MKIKGNLGDKVLLSGIIKKVMVSECGVEYSCCVEGHDFSFWCTEDEIIFEPGAKPEDYLPELQDEDDFRKQYPDRFPDSLVEELKDEEMTPEEIRSANWTECDDNATACDSSATAGNPSREYEEMDEEWFTIEQPKKKRGRPRKATVDDLMKRAKE